MKNPKLEDITQKDLNDLNEIANNLGHLVDWVADQADQATRMAQFTESDSILCREYIAKAKSYQAVIQEMVRRFKPITTRYMERE